VGLSYKQKAYPKNAWPDITFDDTMHFHFNGEDIDLLHFGPAHTTGDAAIIFRGSNAVHLGDVFNNAGYPFIDAGNGGTLDGVIKFCSETLQKIDKDTIVIPGHGPIADYQALSDYIEMLTAIRGRMVALIDDGASLKQVYAARVTKDWDKKIGDSSGFINRAYMSLTHKVVDR
jgi:glyoxylase-like metal-dependent hydrolase (beta-lactamase superfamily II)